MLGWCGVLNFSMVTIAALYIGMGFFGYLKYGADIADSVTLNLPTRAAPAQAALCMFSVAIFFSYALQFYVVMDIIGPNILRPLCSERACSRSQLYGPDCSLICRCDPDNTKM